jgi:sodium-independent sulfate anion transporter 11
VGLGGIVLLIALQKMGQKWGSKSKTIWFVSLARAAIVLVLFTGISYGVNKDIDLKNDDPVWELSKVKVRYLLYEMPLAFMAMVKS